MLHSNGIRIGVAQRRRHVFRILLIVSHVALGHFVQKMLLVERQSPGKTLAESSAHSVQLAQNVRSLHVKGFLHANQLINTLICNYYEAFAIMSRISFTEQLTKRGCFMLLRDLFKSVKLAKSAFSDSGWRTGMSRSW